MIGTSMLLYGLINPVGVVPIYLSLVRRISPDSAHRIIVVSAATVAGLLAAAAGFGREILEFFNVLIGIAVVSTFLAGLCGSHHRSSGCRATRASTLQHV